MLIHWRRHPKEARGRNPIQYHGIRAGRIGSVVTTRHADSDEAEARENWVWPLLSNRLAIPVGPRLTVRLKAYRSNGVRSARGESLSATVTRESRDRRRSVALLVGFALIIGALMGATVALLLLR